MVFVGTHHFSVHQQSMPEHNQIESWTGQIMMSFVLVKASPLLRQGWQHALAGFLLQLSGLDEQEFYSILSLIHI